MSLSYWDLKKALKLHIYTDKEIFNELCDTVYNECMGVFGNAESDISVVNVPEQTFTIHSIHPEETTAEFSKRLDTIRFAVMKGFYHFIEKNYDDIRDILFKHQISLSNVTIPLMDIVNNISVTVNYFDIMIIPNSVEKKSDIQIQF